MTTKEKWKWVYKVVRSLLFTSFAFVAFLFILLYVLLSIPAVQNDIKEVAEQELSKLFRSRLTIENVSIYPFNEVVVEGASLYEPDSNVKCITIQRLGAGISLWRLLTQGKIAITYVELLGLDARLRQDAKDGPMNIQFLIDAFKPKDKNKPPTLFDLEIRNIVIRKCNASFSRPWLKDSESGFFNRCIYSVTKLNADMVLPRLSNDDIEIDLRRLEFLIADAAEVKNLSGKAKIAAGKLALSDIEIEINKSILHPSDITLPLKPEGGFLNYLLSEGTSFSFEAAPLYLPDFAFLWAPLSACDSYMQFFLQSRIDADGINISELKLNTVGHFQGRHAGKPDNNFSLMIGGGLIRMENARNSKGIVFQGFDISDLSIHSSSAFNSQLIRLIGMMKAGKASEGSSRDVMRILSAINDLQLNSKAEVDLISRLGSVSLDVQSGIGDINLNADWLGLPKAERLKLDLFSEGLELESILPDAGIGRVAINLNAEAQLADTFENLGKYSTKNIQQISHLIPSLSLNLSLPQTEISGYNLSDFEIELEKDKNEINTEINCSDENFNFALTAQSYIADNSASLKIDGDIIRLHPAVLRPIRPKFDFELSGDIELSAEGSNLDDIVGNLALENFRFNDLDNKRTITLDKFALNSYIDSDGRRDYSLYSDWIDGDIKGYFLPSRIPMIIHGMLAEAFPEFIKLPQNYSNLKTGDEYFSFNFHIGPGSEWSDFFKLPVSILYDTTISGEFDGMEDKLSLNVISPYILQGKDKLIRSFNLYAMLHEGNANVNAGVIYPTKKGDLELMADFRAVGGNMFAGLDFNPGRSDLFNGHLDMEANISPSIAPLGKEYALHIFPGKLSLNGVAWNVDDALIKFITSPSGNTAEIEGFRVTHADQFVAIDGVASSDPADAIVADLNDVDLDYIFDTLNINYVKFGGRATGKAIASSLFSLNPNLATRDLYVKNLSYNNGVLGDAKMYGNFDLPKKRVGIRAEIAEEGRSVATVDGGIWIGRDSLSFGIDADKVRIDFLYPFMQAFASKVEGRASGNALLYGTFSDVDMKGRLFADTITLGVAYTNVEYSGRDSVIIDPGRIYIPSFTLHDKYGNSAKLQGTLTHDYFHEPQFDFRVSDAKNLLLYDTNASMNPVWYGRIFGSGNGRILGIDNYVGITADMTTQANSNFTFVLSDREEALEYKFIEFTDKKKAARMAKEDIQISLEDEILNTFRKKINHDSSGPESVFGMNLRATITPSTTLTLVMDPVAGDKIVANGSGAMNMTYQSDNDDLRMYGKYVLDNGVYNFSLQDLILKDFIIKEGSSISFNGDPMAGILDIRAAYRVNTNLSDLDQSFALDRDLNRTNVPVDAMLLVNGEMSSPDISFDIELPTLNDEVEQKVRSIISSEDMMNLQMIYLLALNRFYTPEYMGGNSGGEWASVASTTISSQLQNIMGQLTDKFSLLPSFKSDKGDFSDLEVDVALSSRLFNNRLIVNGNFGYRDPSISSTTFIGDFDIEYLLNRQGNWRLKAYNHFNDQNYYLKSALTTQGVGIVWRRDFNHIFGINKKPRQKQSSASSGSDVAPADSLKSAASIPDSVKPAKSSIVF